MPKYGNGGRVGEGVEGGGGWWGVITGLLTYQSQISSLQSSFFLPPANSIWHAKNLANSLHIMRSSLIFPLVPLSPSPCFWMISGWGSSPWPWPKIREEKGYYAYVLKITI